MSEKSPAWGLVAGIRNMFPVISQLSDFRNVTVPQHISIDH